MRASFDRAGHLVDQYVAAPRATDELQLADVQAVYAEVQASKAFVTSDAACAKRVEAAACSTTSAVAASTNVVP